MLHIYLEPSVTRKRDSKSWIDNLLFKMSVKVVAEKDILVPDVDKRQYRYLTLPNKLNVLVVSDDSADKCAACCCVEVGSMQDPAEAQGLAHFLEHMLFMGTEKYPEENEYSAYLNSHGGYSNAYTDSEQTVYYFDVLNDHFEGALDRFASFFTCPLFTESSTDREINAVDSENSKNLRSDVWRKYQLFKSMARPDHPINSFSTGNKETLGDAPKAAGSNIRDMMIAFYKKYYSANLMSVVIYGNSSLDELQKWAVEKFSGIPNHDFPRCTYPSDPFRVEQLQKVVEIVPVR